MFWYEDDSLPIRWRIVDSLTDDDLSLSLCIVHD